MVLYLKDKYNHYEHNGWENTKLFLFARNIKKDGWSRVKDKKNVDQWKECRSMQVHLEGKLCFTFYLLFFSNTLFGLMWTRLYIIKKDDSKHLLMRLFWTANLVTQTSWAVSNQVWMQPWIGLTLKIRIPEKHCGNNETTMDWLRLLTSSSSS